MDRKLWGRWIGYPSWPCPTCQQGSLTIILSSRQTVTSRAERLARQDECNNHHERLDRFTAQMKCDRGLCAETGVLVGNYHTHWMPDGSEEGYTDISYEVLSVVPSPLPFRLGAKVPKAIGAIVREAAALFWLDQDAAASRIREAIEAILTDLGVATLRPSGARLALHSRIDHFRTLDDGRWAEQADIIEAAKWIGNEGTHETVARQSVLDALEMLETVLEDIYVRTRYDLLEKVRATNARFRRPSKMNPPQG